jgi:hypothetical protein
VSEAAVNEKLIRAARWCSALAMVSWVPVIVVFFFMGGPGNQRLAVFALPFLFVMGSTWTRALAPRDPDMRRRSLLMASTTTLLLAFVVGLTLRYLSAW